MYVPFYIGPVYENRCIYLLIFNLIIFAIVL